MIYRINVLASVSLVVLSYALVPGVASAQDEEPAFGEIIVTAQKRSQSVQDVPVSIDVVDQSVFEDRQVDTVSELALAVPGFEFARAPSDSPGVTFRGIGTQAGNVSFDNSIGMFVDGAFLGNVRLYGQTLFDLERVELIKGTQSTLLGKNTSLGAISVVNKRPEFRTSGAFEIGTEIENGGYFGNGFVNVPVGESFALRVAGSYSNLDGWVRNVTTDRQVPQDTDIGIRASMLYEHPDSSLSLLLSYQYTENERWGTANQITDPGLSALGLGAGPELGESEFDDTKASFSSDPRLKDGEDITRLKAHMATATIEYDFGPLALTSVTSGAWFDQINNLDFDFDNKDLNIFARSEDYSQFMQELRLASPGGEDFEYLLGLFYFTSEWSLLQDNQWGIPDFPPGDALEGQIFNGSYTNDFRQRTKAVSTYAQATYRLTEALRVSAGLRYTNERKKVSFGRTNRAPFTLWNTVIQAPFPLQRLETVEDNLVSGSASIQYDVSDDIMIYAGFGRGGKAGGYGEFNSIPIDPELGEGNPQRDAFIGDERANSYEVGVKSILADVLSVNAAFFYMDLFGLQQLAFNGQFVSSNDRARSVGVEGTVIWEATDTLSFSGSGTYADAELLDLDQRLAQSPRFSGSLRADWEDDLSPDLVLKLGTGLKHRSSKFNQLGEGLLTPSYTTAFLNARLSNEASGWFINLAVENLTNEIGADFGFVGTDPFVGTFETLAPLRSIKLSAGIKF